MRIISINPIPMSCSIPEDETWRLGGGLAADGRTYLPGRMGVKVDLLIVKVVADDGHTGIGEIAVGRGVRDLPEQLKLLEHLKPRLIGLDPFDEDRFRELMYCCVDLTEERLVSAVNVACWDIRGKVMRRPLYSLLGGTGRRWVRAYASGGIDWRYIRDPSIIVKEAVEYLEQGWSAFKFRIPADERCVDAIKAIRDAIGYEMDLIIEANMRFKDAEHAIKIAKKFEKYEPLWFEEPIAAKTSSDIDSHMQIRKALPKIPISGGEEKISLKEYMPWIECHAYDIVQPDACITGPYEAMLIAYQASHHSLSCCPHNWHNVVSNAANLHVAAAIPNNLLLEFQTTWLNSCPAFRALEGTEIIEKPIELRKGRVKVPRGPGLGIELDEAACKKYPYIDGPTTTPWAFN